MFRNVIFNNLGPWQNQKLKKNNFKIFLLKEKHFVNRQDVIRFKSKIILNNNYYYKKGQFKSIQFKNVKMYYK